MTDPTMTTLDYYNSNAGGFVATTADVEFTSMQSRFADLLPDGARVLDFGCGSGRDSKYFLSRGFDVTATDGSEELVRIASDATGIAVRHELFQDLADVDAFDGVWACSSILHLPKAELADVMNRIAVALRRGGILYTSFKYGEFEGERNGRYFTDFTWDSFQDFMTGVAGLTVQDHWTTGDVRPGRGEEKWLNLLLRKS